MRGGECGDTDREECERVWRQRKKSVRECERVWRDRGKGV